MKSDLIDRGSPRSGAFMVRVEELDAEHYLNNYQSENAATCLNDVVFRCTAEKPPSFCEVPEFCCTSFHSSFDDGAFYSWFHLKNRNFSSRS